MNSYVQVFKRAFDFTGRSRRREFWLFVLVNLVVTAVLTALDTLLGLGGVTTLTGPGYAFTYLAPGLLGSIYNVVVLIPNIAVSIRRLHDTDRSGWWLFIALLPLIGAIVLIVFWAMEGTRGANRFGADPKSAELVGA
jgi:uncharacterized membrane protein YhaH (DUF805 family)